MVILRRADHYHFMDNASEVHDTVRAMPAVGGLEWLREMLPFSELCPAEPAREFVRGLTLWHFDAALRQREAARRFWRSDVEGALAERGIGAVAPGSAHDMDTRNEPLARVSHDPR
jgi:hypothetical protein